MAQQDFKINGLNASNVKLRSNGFFTTLTANADLAANVSLQLPGSDGTTGQVLTTDGGGNLFFATSTADSAVYVGDTLVSNNAIILEAGDGMSISGNATSSVVTFTTEMSNVTSQEFSLDGTANSFTLSKSASNTHMMLVFYNGIAQKPTDYTVSGTTLTLSNTRPIIADSELEVRFFDFFDMSGVSAGAPAPSTTPQQGSTTAYSSGGRNSSSPYLNTIEKFAFSNLTPSSVGTLAVTGLFNGAGNSSSDNGYIAGKFHPTGDTIQKFPFSSDTNSVDIAELTVAIGYSAAASSLTDGYAYGGYSSSDTMQKFPFSSDSPASDIGELTNAGYDGVANSSKENGYVKYSPNPGTIQKHPFSSDSSAANLGQNTHGPSFGQSGANSSTHGYHLGGGGPNNITAMTKFNFSSESEIDSVGSLAANHYRGGGTSDESNGYAKGGRPTNPSYIDNIQRFPFSSDTDATDVGELSADRGHMANHQV